MSFSLPPIVKLAERLLVDIEQAVRRFARYHKYSIGTDLRKRAMQIAQFAHRAWRDGAHRQEWTRKLVWAVDDLKLNLQIGSRIRAFASFAQFEALVRTAAELGCQVGGWFKQQHAKGQNAGAGRAPQQRAQILSDSAASLFEANP